MARFSTLIADIASTYAGDTILILGKGPSADAVDRRVFSRAVTIGLNDAERISPVDITLFHEDWVRKGLEASGFRSQLYLTSTDFIAPKGRETVHLPHYPLTQESSDLIMQRFLSDEAAIEDILFLSALKVARQIAEARGRPQTVYMVGFDFSAQAGYSESLAADYVPHDADVRAATISLQEFYYLNALYFLKGSNLDVRHVGTRAFSMLTPEELNVELLGESARAPHQTFETKVIAELTTNHFGDRSRLERMIRLAAAAGADYVKLQKRDVDSFYSEEQRRSPYRSPFGPTFADYRHALELNEDDFAAVDALCRELGIDWFASVLDLPSYRFMRQFDRDLIKLPSTISEYKDYLAHVASEHRGGIVLSTGMTDQSYETWVLETFTRCERLYLMQANSAYPTPLNDCNVAVIRRYEQLALTHPRIVPAYSSHDFGSKASTLAVAAGAKMVEKHVKLGNTEWAHFDAVAVDLLSSSFRDYVSAIRETETILGSSEKKINASEHHKYRIPKAAA